MSVLHYQRSPSSTYCGRALPIRATRDLATFADDDGKCSQCAKAVAIRGLYRRPIAPITAAQ